MIANIEVFKADMHRCSISHFCTWWIFSSTPVIVSTTAFILIGVRKSTCHSSQTSKSVHHCVGGVIHDLAILENKFKIILRMFTKLVELFENVSLDWCMTELLDILCLQWQNIEIKFSFINQSVLIITLIDHPSHLTSCC